MVDNYELWERHDNEMESKLAKQPICSCCGDYIQQDMAVYYNGEWICDDCLGEMRISVE